MITSNVNVLDLKHLKMCCCCSESLPNNHLESNSYNHNSEQIQKICSRPSKSYIIMFLAL